MDWMEALTRMLDYIESHLDTPMDAAEAARASGYSVFYIQRIFGVMTGMTVGSYIRQRRLSEAGLMLRRGASVLDTALRYAWDSPESFARAFRRFHGVNPSQVQAGGALKCVTPLRIRLALTGGHSMTFTIEPKPAMTIIGLSRRFASEGSFTAIPAFWDEYRAKGLEAVSPARLGICMDDCPTRDDCLYMIGRFASPEEPVPEGFTRRELPACTWAVFQCRGPMPQAMQDLNRQIFTEWLPSSGAWALAQDVSIEVYGEGDMSLPDYQSAIMIPVKRKP